MECIQRELTRLREVTCSTQVHVTELRDRVIKIEARLEHMPTSLAMWGALTMVTLAVGSGLWWIVQQYLGPLLARAAIG